MDGREVDKLWRDYLFLTEEMAKMLLRSDLELFYELLEQRGRLAEAIEAAGSAGYAAANEGQQMYQRLLGLESQIKLRLQYLINTGRKQQEISQAYDGYGSSALVGRILNRST